MADFFEIQTFFWQHRVSIVIGLISPRHMSDKHETAEKGVSDERGRRKTAELHTSGAKRADTWRGGVK